MENDDQDFVKMAAQLGMAEVQKGMLGTKKASREEVKALAEKMVTDHTMMNDEQKTLASSKAVEISAVIDPNATEALKDLENKATGEEFDKAFLDEMEKDHEKTISAFEDAAKDGKDAQVKAFAEKHLPHLRSHLEQVKSLKDNK